MKSYQVYSNHNRIKLEIIERHEYFPVLKLNNIPLSNPWIKKTITGEILKYLDLNDNENIHTKICGMKLKEYFRLRNL